MGCAGLIKQRWTERCQDADGDRCRERAIEDQGSRIEGRGCDWSTDLSDWAAGLGGERVREGRSCRALS